jgi:hypothetical protein
MCNPNFLWYLNSQDPFLNIKIYFRNENPPPKLKRVQAIRLWVTFCFLGALPPGPPVGAVPQTPIGAYPAPVPGVMGGGFRFPPRHPSHSQRPGALPLDPSPG